MFNSDGIWGEKSLPEFPDKESFLFTSPFIHPTILIRSNVINSLFGYKVSKETLRAEDYDLFMRMYSKGYKGYNIQKALYYFREDNNTYKRRAYRYRLDEAKVRYKGFKSLGLMPKAIPYVIKPRRAGDIATCYCDPSKAERELGWKAQYGIREMCADSWRWQKNNPNGYED